MRALAAEADVETRYGGRFVQSVNGIEGSLGEQRDWFWFVNGYEGDRSAASYKLRDGDVAWLDYRGWEREGEARVVVGAFPEPFVHGYDGKTRPAVVRYDRAAGHGRRGSRAKSVGRGRSRRSGRRCRRARTCSRCARGESRLTGGAARRDRGRSRSLRPSAAPRRYERRYSVP